MRSLPFAPVLLLAALSLSRPSLAGPIEIGGFESGNLSGWTFSGAGGSTVLPALGDILPLFGGLMALLSTGPGDRGGALDQAQLLSDPFTLSPGDSIEIWIRRLTAEFTGGFADPARLDGFAVQLAPLGGGPPVPLHSSDVSDPAFEPIPNAPVSAAAGDTFFDYAPWIRLTATGLSGDYRLSVMVWDAGDNAFDSAVLIDGAAIPEPGSMVLFFTALGLAAIKLHRSRRAGKGGMQQ